MIRHLILALSLAGPAGAETLVAAHTIRAKSVVTASDLTRIARTIPGGLDDPSRIVGQEARVTLYAGRPIGPGDVGPPALVERNQIVTMVYAGQGVTIFTDGRVLDRAGAGDRVRVMNLGSRATVTGTVMPDGQVHVSEGPS